MCKMNCQLHLYLKYIIDLSNFVSDFVDDAWQEIYCNVFDQESYPRSMLCVKAGFVITKWLLKQFFKYSIFVLYTEGVHIIFWGNASRRVHSTPYVFINSSDKHALDKHYYFIIRSVWFGIQFWNTTFTN